MVVDDDVVPVFVVAKPVVRGLGVGGGNGASNPSGKQDGG